MIATMNDEITIDEQIVNYANEMYPHVTSVGLYYAALSDLFDAFTSYRGDARKEIDENYQQIMMQMEQLMNGYSSLIQHLNTMIVAFKEVDEKLATKIMGYVDTIEKNAEKWKAYG